MTRTLSDAVYGAAVGDALGVPYEFSGRDSFQVKDKMLGGGVHNQPAGTFSDISNLENAQYSPSALPMAA